MCGFVAASLGLQRTTVQPTEIGLLPISIARGHKRTQMLCLRVQSPLALVVGTGAMPLADVIGFVDGCFMVDQVVVRQLVDAATTADPRHTPSTVKREARKMDTQAIYVTWQKAYDALRKKSPGHSDVWYSQQIAKTPAGKVATPAPSRKTCFPEIVGRKVFAQLSRLTTHRFALFCSRPNNPPPL